MRLHERTQRSRQVYQRTLGNRHREQARGNIGQADHLPLEEQAGPFDGLRLGAQALTAGAQAVAALAPVEQAHTVHLLQAGDAPPHGHVGHAQFTRRGAQRTAAREREEVTDVIPLHMYIFFQ